MEQILALAEKNRLIAEWKKGNQNKKSFCEGKGIKVGTFSKWITKYNKAQNNFVEITPPKVKIVENYQKIVVRIKEVEIECSFHDLEKVLQIVVSL